MLYPPMDSNCIPDEANTTYAAQILAISPSFPLYVLCPGGNTPPHSTPEQIPHQLRLHVITTHWQNFSIPFSPQDLSQL